MPVLESPATTEQVSIEPVVSDPQNEPTAETAAKPPTDTSIRIFGTVTSARTGAPIPDAIVIAAAKSGLVEILESTDDDTMVLPDGVDFDGFSNGAVAETKSNSQGAFEIAFSKQPRRLTCIAPGYAVAYQNLDDDASASLRVDFQLFPEAVVAGRVADSEGNGVGDLTVTVEDVRQPKLSIGPVGFEPDIETYPDTTTEPDGSFALDGLAQGNFRVVVKAAEQGYLFDTTQAPIVNLEEGEVVEGVALTVRLGGTVQGTVRDPEGNPLKMASVFAFYSSTEVDNPLGMFAGDLEATTNAEGQFTIRPVTPGIGFNLAAQHEKWASTKVEDLRIDDAAQSLAIDLILTRGSQVSGSVVDPNGAPVPDAEVMISKSSIGFPFDPTGMNWQESGEDGSFAFPHVSPGLYTLEAEDTTVEVEVLEGQDLTGLKLAVDAEPKPEAVLEGIVLGLDGAPAGGVNVALKSLFMEYTVNETVTGDDGTFKLEDVSELVETSVTVQDEAGDSFVPPAMFELRAQSEDGVAVEKNIDPNARIILRLRQAVRVSGIVLTADGEPASRCPVSLVKEKSGNNPLDEGMFAAMGGAFAMFGEDGGVATDESGQFTFKNVDPGTYTVEAISKTQGAGLSQSFAVTETAGHDNITVRLERGVSFAGQVTGPDGQPVSGALVELYRSQGEGAFAEMAGSMFAGMFGEAQGAGTTDGQGHFAIHNVPHGTYQVRATHTDYAPTVGRGVTLASGRDTSGYDIVLTRGGGVRGTVSHAGVPTPNAMVMISNTDASKQTATNAEGRFEVTGLPAGTYMVMSMQMNFTGSDDEDAMPRTQSVTVVADQITEIDIATGLGVAVTGTVTGAAPDANVAIRIVPEGTAPPAEDLSADDPMAFLAFMDFANMAEVEEDGTFTLPDVNPGTYTLEVMVFTKEFAEMVTPDRNTQRETTNFKPIHTQTITVGSDPVTVDVALP